VSQKQETPKYQLGLLIIIIYSIDKRLTDRNLDVVYILSVHFGIWTYHYCCVRTESWTI